MDIDSRVSERNSGLKMSYRTSRNRTMCHYLLFRVFAEKSKGPMKLLTFVQKRKVFWSHLDFFWPSENDPAGNDKKVGNGPKRRGRTIKIILRSGQG